MIKIKIITISVGFYAFSAFAAFNAIIPSDNYITTKDGSNPIVPDTTIRCGTGDGVTRTELLAMIDQGDDVTEVCTSNISDFSSIFDVTRSGADKNIIKTFNQKIGNWDTAKSVTFREMFMGAEAFNQDISKWDTAKVKDFYGTFWTAESFNQPIGNWDVSRGLDFEQTFWDAKAFNQDVHLWNVKKANTGKNFGGFSSLTVDNMPCKFGGNCSLDSDNDGVLDHDEVYNGTDPLDPNN